MRQWHRYCLYLLSYHWDSGECTLELLLIRHGESMADVDGLIEGSFDAPLSERGRRQVWALADRLRGTYQCDELYSSPLSRAHETALHVGEAIHATVITDPRLAEIDTGRLAGMKFEEADRLYPEPAGGRKIHDPFPGGESALSFTRRVAEFYSELAETYMDKRICIVAHGGTLSILLRLAYGLPQNGPFRHPRFITNDTGMHRLDVLGPMDVLTHFLNDASHAREI